MDKKIKTFSAAIDEYTRTNNAELNKKQIAAFQYFYQMGFICGQSCVNHNAEYNEQVVLSLFALKPYIDALYNAGSVASVEKQMKLLDDIRHGNNIILSNDGLE